MNKPTPFRLAVNHLKSLGIIRRDNELLPMLGMTSKGALAAYIGGTAPKHIIDKFLNKYREHVAQFFQEENITNVSNGKHYTMKAETATFALRDPRDLEFIESLKADKVFYQRVIENNLASINTTLAKLIELGESINSAALSTSSETDEEDSDDDRTLLASQQLGGKSTAPSRQTGQGNPILSKDSNRRGRGSKS